MSGTSLVNFYTADCEASKKLAPTIDKLATQYANTADIEVVKVDCGKQELQGLCENEEVTIFLNKAKLFQEAKFIIIIFTYLK